MVYVVSSCVHLRIKPNNSDTQSTQTRIKNSLSITNFLQIDLIENYNKSLEFLKAFAAEQLPTSLHVVDKDVTLNITGLYYLAIPTSVINLDMKNREQ